MQNANGSLTANLGNRRVRGTKPDDGAGAGAGDDGAAAARARRENALNLRRARQAEGGNGTPAPNKRTRMSSAVADELGDATAPPLKSKTQKVAAIAELLRHGIDDDGDGDDAGDADDTGDQAPGDDGLGDEGQPEARTLEAIAETLGVDLAELWETATFRDSTGKEHKLGELKDTLQANVDIDARELEFSERKSADENDLMRQRQELEYILRSLPKSAVTPELTARAKSERDRVLKLEGDRLAAAIPEWRNDETRKTERAAIGQWMTQYGFGAGDIERQFDHRMQKLLRDSWQRHERVTKALAKVKEQRDGEAKGPARAQNGQRRQKAPQVGPNATRTQKVAAVAHLLRTGIQD